MTQRHRQLDLLAYRLDRAANVIPEVLDHLDEQRALTSIVGHGSGGTHGSGHADPVLRAVLSLDAGEYRRRTLLDAIHTLGVCVDMLEDAARQALSYRAGQHAQPMPDETAKPRCIGDNTAKGATCWNIPSPRRNTDGTNIDDGRCTDCGARFDERHSAERMRIEQNRRLRRHRK